MFFLQSLSVSCENISTDSGEACTELLGAVDYARELCAFMDFH